MATPDYEAIASKMMRDPGEGPPRVLVYSRNKQGKSRFAWTAPNVLLIDPEAGSKELPKKDDNSKVWPVNNWSDINEVFRYAQTSKKFPFQNIAVDGMTKIHNMALRFVMKQQEERDLDRIPGMVQQRDYGRAGELSKGMIYNFQSLPVGLIFTTQDRMDTGDFSDTEDEDDMSEDVAARFVPDLPRGVRSTLNSVVGVIGRIYTVRIEGTRNGQTVKGVQRRLWLSPSDKYDTGFRSELYRGTPPYLKRPTVERLQQLLKEGKVQ